MVRICNIIIVLKVNNSDCVKVLSIRHKANNIISMVMSIIIRFRKFVSILYILMIIIIILVVEISSCVIFR